LRIESRRLFHLVDDYFEGAGQGSGNANDLALGAPIAFFCRIHSYHIADHYQHVVVAYINAQPAAVTFFGVYYRHFKHYLFNPTLNLYNLYVTFISLGRLCHLH
jgi:hypothetical protein